jgi:predicted RNase H-like nuclease (RuvC/YqgF family)
MATKLAQSQLAELPERVGVVETKVEHLNEKMDDLKVDVKEMHDCLDQTRDTVVAQLHVMTDEYRTNASKYYEHADKLNAQQSAQHAELASKIDELEKLKSKGMIYGMAVMAFLVGSGWAGHLNLAAITKFIGL